MALTERPYQYCYSKNEIRYVFNLASPERAGLFLQVKLFWANIDETGFVALYNFEALKPNAEGMVYLPVQAYLDSLLNYVMPVIDEPIINAKAQTIQFYIHYREVEDTNPDPVWTETEEEHICIAIKGGIERHKASRNNIFINYINTEKPFLTWQPSGRFIFYGEHVFLSFLNFSRAGFTLKGLIKATDATEVLFTISFNEEEGLLYHIPVSPTALDLAGKTAKQIWYYEISITDLEDNIIAQPYRLYIEYRSLYEYHDLVYIGSLGGADALRVSGETNITYDKTVVEGEGGLAVNDWNAVVKSHEQTHESILLKRSYKAVVSTLKTRTREQAESFLDLIVSKKIYMLFNNTWIPVLNVQQSAELGNRKNITSGFPLEWKLSESNQVFTPAGKNFGQGSL